MWFIWDVVEVSRFKLQIRLPVLSLFQGKVSIRLVQMSHLRGGPWCSMGSKYGAWGQHEVRPYSPSQISVLPVSDCSFPLHLLLFTSCWIHSWINNCPLHTGLSFLWEAFALKSPIFANKKLKTEGRINTEEGHRKKWQLRWNGKYFQEHFYSSHNPTSFCSFFLSPIHLHCNAPTQSEVKPYFWGDLIQLNWTEPWWNQNGNRGSQSDSWALLGPQPVECHHHPLASLEISGAEAASGWRVQVVAAAPLCSVVQTSVQWQLLSWKAFQDKLWVLNDDKCQGHKRCCSQILFPTFLALSYGLNLNTQAVRRPEWSSSL